MRKNQNLKVPLQQKIYLENEYHRQQNIDKIQFVINKNKNKIQMGQQSSSISQANRLYEMPLSQYRLKERVNSAISFWTHKSAPYEELIESRIVVTTQKELQNIYDIFRLRHMHIYLSPTRYLTCELQGIKGCGGYYKGNIYVESAIITLAMINDIPFYDSLHLLSVALKGFQILYRKFGYFEIFQDMFHIYQSGKLKVWCNSQVYKLGPQPYLLDSSGKQDDMVYKIINLIDQNVDQSQLTNIKRILYHKIHPQTHFQSFQHINAILRQVCKQNNWQPPQKLRCITHLTKQQMERLQSFQHHNSQIIQQHNNINNNLGSLSSLNERLINNIKQVNEGKTSIRITPQIHNDHQRNTSILNMQQGFQTFGNSFNASHHYPATNIQTAPNLSITSLTSPHQQISNPPFFISSKQQPINRVNISQPQINIKPTYRSFSADKTQTQIPQYKLYRPNFDQMIHKNNSIRSASTLKPFPQQKPIQINSSFSARPQQNRTYYRNHVEVKPTNVAKNNYQNFPTPYLNQTAQLIAKPTQAQQIIKNEKIPNIPHSSHKYLQNPSTLSTFTTISIPSVGTPNYVANNKIVQSKYTTNFKQSKNQDKLLKSIIIHDPIKSASNSKLMASQAIQRIDRNYKEKYNFQFQNYHPAKDSVSKIVENIEQPYQYKQKQNKIQTNIQPNYSQPIPIKQQKYIQVKSSNKTSQFINEKKKQFEAKKLQILSKYPNYKSHNKPNIINKHQSDFTDPRLMQLLSQNQKPNNIKPISYNFTGSKLFPELQQMKKAEENSELFYSFSKITDESHLQKNSNSYESSGKFIQIQPTVNNSQSSGSLSKKYGAEIDKQIWKDLVELKKTKNLY